MHTVYFRTSVWSRFFCFILSLIFMFLILHLVYEPLFGTDPSLRFLHSIISSFDPRWCWMITPESLHCIFDCISMLSVFALFFEDSEKLLESNKITKRYLSHLPNVNFCQFRQNFKISFPAPKSKSRIPPSKVSILFSDFCTVISQLFRPLIGPQRWLILSPLYIQYDLYKVWVGFN